MIEGLKLNEFTKLRARPEKASFSHLGDVSLASILSDIVCSLVQYVTWSEKILFPGDLCAATLVVSPR